jgi:hypothetical protein
MQHGTDLDLLAISGILLPPRHRAQLLDMHNGERRQSMKGRDVESANIHAVS